MASELSRRQKAWAMATELRIIQINETHQEHLYLLPDNACDTHVWTYVFYVLIFLVIAFVIFSFGMLGYLARHERTEEQRLRTLAERFRACNRICPDCGAAMYENEERVTGQHYSSERPVTPQHYSDGNEEEPDSPQYYSDGNPAASDWPETDLLNPD